MGASRHASGVMVRRSAAISCPAVPQCRRLACPNTACNEDRQVACAVTAEGKELRQLYPKVWAFGKTTRQPAAIMCTEVGRASAVAACKARHQACFMYNS